MVLMRFTHVTQLTAGRKIGRTNCIAYSLARRNIQKHSCPTNLRNIVGDVEKTAGFSVDGNAFDRWRKSRSNANVRFRAS